jgi:hypothetical protein
MEKRGALLAAAEGFGKVYDCGSCGNIHIQVGMVSLSLSPTDYMQLVAMLSTSAANFETWMEEKASTA